MIMDENHSHGIDMIGPSLNMCSKINRFAKINEIVVGGDLYEAAKKLPDYHFSSQGRLTDEIQSEYPVYVVTRK